MNNYFEETAIDKYLVEKDIEDHMEKNGMKIPRKKYSKTYPANETDPYDDEFYGCPNDDYEYMDEEERVMRAIEEGNGDAYGY